MPAQQLWFLDTLVTVRVPSEAGVDGISILESLAPHGDSPPLHVHATEDEAFHVLEGTLRMRVDGRDIEARAGEWLLAPKGAPHTYRVESECARWLTVTTGGDFEALVRDLGREPASPELPKRSGPPSEAAQQALAEAAARHGIEFVGPPL